MLQRDVRGRGNQEMNVFGHEDEGVELIASFSAVPIQSLQEQSSVGFDNEQSTTLPRRERHEVGPGRGDESSRLQSKPQRLEAASFA